MKLPRLDFLRRSIGAKIIFWFLAINIVSCGLLAWRTYDISREVSRAGDSEVAAGRRKKESGAAGDF